MENQNKVAFLQVWPKWFVIILGVIEVLAFIVLIITELGNVASNFWTTNVFAGGWCGLVMLVHFIALFVAGCCAPGPPAAFRAFVITLVALVACAALITFDAIFLALPSTCILTSSCSSNAVSTTVFTYSFQQDFFVVLHRLSPFSNYTQSQAKYLFQVVQIGVGSLCFALCILYIIVYFASKNKAKQQVAPRMMQQRTNAPQPNYQQQGPSYPQQQGAGYPQQQMPVYPNVPQGPSYGDPWQPNQY